METVRTETFPSIFSGRVHLRQRLLFWIAAGVLLFIFLDTSSFRETEAFRAETCREMLLTGNWFQPVFNWKEIYGHSFLSYWLAFPFVKLFGISEFSFRLPSVLAALTALYGVRAAGRGLFNEKTASLAGWMLLGSVGFLLWGRCGSTEIIGMAAGICAVAWYLRREEKNFLTWIIFYVIAFAGFCFCGVPALLIPSAAVLPLSIRAYKKNPKELWNNAGAFFLGALFFLFVLHLPLILSDETVPKREVFSFFLGHRFREITSQIRGFSLGEYAESCLLYLPRVLLPWTPLLLVGIWNLFRNHHELPEKVKLIIAGTAAAVLLAPLCGTENGLLAAAPLAVLAGCGGVICDRENKWTDLAVSAAFYILLTAASAAVCSIVGYPLWDKLTVLVPSASLLLWPVAAGAAAWFVLFLDYRKDNLLTVVTGLPHRLGSTVIAGTMLTGLCMSVLQPVSHAEFGCSLRSFGKLREIALRELPEYSTERIIFYRMPVSGGFLFYSTLLSPVSSAENLREVPGQFSGSKVLFVVRDDKTLQEEFLKECRALNIKTNPVPLSSLRSPGCGGEAHYSVFPAALPQIRKKPASVKESKK